MRRPILLLSVAALIALQACSGKSAPPPPSPPEVSVLKLSARSATVTEEYVAQTEARNTIEIRPRVGGLLERQVAIEGERVEKGQLLFTIDPQPYIAAQAQARAALAQARAGMEESDRELSRVRSLFAAGVSSQQEMDASVAKNDSNKAAVQVAQASLRAADLNVGYTSITSPIDGVMGRAALKVGGLVTAYSTLLATVYSIDPMYVDFSISEQRLLQLQRTLGRALNQNSKTAPPFRIVLADGNEYPHPAKLNFIDAAVDQRTGTLAVRLEVPNPDRLLLAGQFARVLVPGQEDPHALLIPQRAVQELQGKNFVWVVDAEGKAQPRDVVMGARLGNDWIVQSGLTEGDDVVVDGVQKLKAGVPVHAAPYTPEVPPTDTPPGATSRSGGGA